MLELSRNKYSKHFIGMIRILKHRDLDFRFDVIKMSLIISSLCHGHPFYFRGNNDPYGLESIGAAVFGVMNQNAVLFQVTRAASLNDVDG
jgi:phage terminase large subunit